VLVPLTGTMSSYEYVDPFWGVFLDGIATYVILGIAGVGAANVVLA